VSGLSSLSGRGDRAHELRASVLARRLAFLVCMLLIVLGTGLLITAPTLQLSTHVQALGSTSGETIRAVALTAPLETVVPSQGARTDWRLRPSYGIGPVATSTVTAATVEHRRIEVAEPVDLGVFDDATRTRAPPV